MRFAVVRVCSTYQNTAVCDVQSHPIKSHMRLYQTTRLKNDQRAAIANGGHIGPGK